MDDKPGRVSALLREAGEIHHAVYRIVDGDDPDWPTWYARWLTELSELPEILGSKPTRSELTWLLVELDREFREASPDESWQDVYARRIVDHFSS
jgi:hypothetical protein